MTPLEKDLVYGDLCARLPYNVYVEVKNAFDDVSTWKLDAYTLQEIQKWKSIKPYLRPMSSMTKEEEDELCELCTLSDCNINSDWEFCGVEIIHSHPRYGAYFSTDYSAINWLDKKMFDYRGLIPKGLANKAPDGMYNN